MQKFCSVVFALAVTASLALAEGRPTRFWNLTRYTISELYLAPAGTTNWGPNQCKNDKDGTVDPDERLPITGVPPGRYDVKLVDASGRPPTAFWKDAAGTGRYRASSNRDRASVCPGCGARDPRPLVKTWCA